jgi:hypothetical protein
MGELDRILNYASSKRGKAFNKKCLNLKLIPENQNNYSNTNAKLFKIRN